MIEIHSQEGLMVWVMNRLSELYPKNAILKGGMVLRLLDCPRYTNDLDYVFIPFDSKKNLPPFFKEAFRDLEGSKMETFFHSTSLRVILSYQGFQIQIEANVAEACKTEPMSTSALAKPNQQLPHVIAVMSFDVALAHKLAAWNERDLIRDLYDIYFFHTILKVKPDLKTLRERLANIQSQKKQKEKQPKQMSLEEFKKKLNEQAEKLSQHDVDEELRDYLVPGERAGLDKKIKIALSQLVEEL